TTPRAPLDLAPDSPVSPALGRRLQGLCGAAARAAGAGCVEEGREIDVLRACSAAIDHDPDRAAGQVVANDAAIAERACAALARTNGDTEGQHTQENVVVGAGVKLRDLKTGGVIAVAVAVGHFGARDAGAHDVAVDRYLVQRVVRGAGVSNHVEVPGGGGRIVVSVIEGARHHEFVARAHRGFGSAGEGAHRELVDGGAGCGCGATGRTIVPREGVDPRGTWVNDGAVDNPEIVVQLRRLGDSSCCGINGVKVPTRADGFGGRRLAQR